MPRPILLLPILLTAMASGCGWFVGNYEIDSIYSYSLEISNASQEEIELATISGSADAKATFGIFGEPLPPGSKQRWPIAYDEYEDILAGRFILEGRCGSSDNELMNGIALKDHIVQQADQGLVSVSIPSCELWDAGRIDLPPATVN